MVRRLGPARQQRLVDIALELVEKLYVHLPLKRSMYAVNPLQRLRLLQRRIGASTVAPTPDRVFYSEMLAIFAQLRDLHTAFVLPEPLRSTTAYLPFKLEACFHRGQRLYVVSHLIRDPSETPDIERGAVVTHLERYSDRSRRGTERRA